MTYIYYSGKRSSRLISAMQTIEDKLKIDFGVTGIYVINRWHLPNNYGYFDNGEVVIGETSFEDQKNILYHELFHALCWNYNIPKRMLKKFHYRHHDESLWDSISYGIRSSFGNYLPRSKNFPSAYAEVDADECAADCFALIIENGFHSHRRYVDFDNETIDLEEEPILKRKLLQVKKIIQYCKRR